VPGCDVGGGWCLDMLWRGERGAAPGAGARAWPRGARSLGQGRSGFALADVRQPSRSAMRRTVVLSITHPLTRAGEPSGIGGVSSPCPSSRRFTSWNHKQEVSQSLQLDIFSHFRGGGGDPSTAVGAGRGRPCAPPTRAGQRASAARATKRRRSEQDYSLDSQLSVTNHDPTAKRCTFLFCKPFLNWSFPC